MDASVKSKIAIAGTGPVARAFAKLLIGIGQPPAYILSRDRGTANTVAHDLGNKVEGATYSVLPPDVSHLLLAVPDVAVHSVAAHFEEMPGLEVAVHTAGGLSLEALHNLANQGTSTAVLHPLQTLPKQVFVPLTGAPFAVWGSGPAAAWSEQLVAKANGQLLRMAPEHQALYHAAAVMASNQLLALLDSSEYLFECAGIAREQARRALHPLVTTTIEGSLRAGPESALTGPVARGDAGTVHSHLLALAEAPAEIRNLYVSASHRLVTMAKRKGLSPEKLAQVEAALMMEG